MDDQRSPDDGDRAPGGAVAGHVSDDKLHVSAAEGLQVNRGADEVQVMRWGTPTWAAHGLEVEGGWLHSYEATIVPLEGDEGTERPCPVRVESTDLAYAEGDQTVLRRFGPRIFIGDIAQLSLPEAQRLVAALTEVIDRVEKS